MLVLTILKLVIDNKRFTMRDIGKLEKRIERLVFYIPECIEKETGARCHLKNLRTHSLIQLVLGSRMEFL